MIEVIRNKAGKVVALRGKTAPALRTGHRNPFHIGHSEFSKCHIKPDPDIEGVRIEVSGETTYRVENADFDVVSLAIIEGMEE